MQFLKKHYEKVLLSIVLLGLAAAAAALPWQVSHERDRLEEIRRNLTVKVRPKPFKPLDDWLATNKAVLARLEAPLNLELAGTHNLFNPVPWKKMPDGRLVPIRTGSEIGPGAVKIAQLRELTLTVAFETVVPGAQGEPPKYTVSVTRETDMNPRANKRTTEVGKRNDLFELLRVEGATNDPVALVIKMNGEIQPITVSKDKAYVRPVGHAADLVYAPPGISKPQKFPNKKPGDTIRLEDDPETYKIVAITQSEVVLSADSNKRRWVIKYNASTASSK